MAANSREAVMATIDQMVLNPTSDMLEKCASVLALQAECGVPVDWAVKATSTINVIIHLGDTIEPDQLAYLYEHAAVARRLSETAVAGEGVDHG